MRTRSAQRLFYSFLLALMHLPAGAQHNPGMYDYIWHPQEGDSVCAKDLRKAEKEIAAGQLHIVYFADPRAAMPRYLQELRQLSGEMKLPLVHYSGSSFIVQGQRRGCYAYRMDAEISSRFGTAFNDSIRRLADERFVRNHVSDTLPAHTCDRPARPVSAEHFDALHFSVTAPEKFAQPLASYDHKKPNLVLECVVDKEGDLAAVELTDELPLTNFPAAHTGELLKLAREALLQTGKWEPSELGEHRVASRVFIGVYFIPLSKED